MATTTFSQWIGGGDKTQLIEAVPSAIIHRTYDFGVDVTGWTFVTTYQTIVVDTIQVDRNTGERNFANSKYIGAFPEVTVAAPYEPEITDALLGTVKVYFPPDMYDGPIIPDKQQNIPIVVVGFSWTTATTPPESNNMRWGVVQNWQPMAPEGDPTGYAGFVPFSV